MSKLYDDVKKQGEQIDGLQKTVTNHGTRIETLETKAKATPPSQTQTMPSEVKVVLPDNIATKENIVGVVNKALHLMTDYVAEVVTKLYTENPPQKSPNPASEISDEQIEKNCTESSRQSSQQALREAGCNGGHRDAPHL